MSDMMHYSFYPQTIAQGRVWIGPSLDIGNKVVAEAARLTGPWNPAGQETLDWTDFDEETIDCVLKFCYFQDYNVPWKVPSVKEDPAQETSSAEHNSKTGSSLADRTDTGNAIVLHAKVYSFALRYLVNGLQQYALAEMEDCFEPFLSEYCISPEATYPRLVDAIRIIYGTTPPSSIFGMDSARRKLCMFIATYHTHFRQYFNEFQEGTGEFMTDLACSLSQLLCEAEMERDYDKEEV
ncbi:hypothetical protein N7517_001653 [Penicillium concentricum]|uniref:BTB domain-containing protein n=1 Tax=Penicillium concentricum TaxID=293559 RepID=A0A9W9VJ23_9EURO|nr:uncharacterized protein N7517_001653 [Penicillium concentricum]KAJ5383742.1 hypothetical protein N7517_001653 [Penicillium concentricum]